MELTLRQARRLRDLSQNDMAQRLGVHPQTYRKIESDPGRATIYQAHEIAKILEFDYDEIFFERSSSLNREAS